MHPIGMNSKRVTFWDQLDYIGVDAYFPLTDSKSPTVEDFESGWKPHKEQIQVIQSKFDKPVLFTEFGYRSIDYTGKEPWTSNRVEGSINLEAQTNGLQAIYNQFWTEEWFAGGFVWKWFLKHERVGGPRQQSIYTTEQTCRKITSEIIWIKLKDELFFTTHCP